MAVIAQRRVVVGGAAPISSADHGGGKRRSAIKALQRSRLTRNQTVKPHLVSMASPNQGAPEQRLVLSKVEARQGVTGQNVRYVLWFGLAAVIVAFAAIYLFYFA